MALTGVREAAVRPLSAMRRTIARRMKQSVNEKPHVTLHTVASAQGLVDTAKREHLSPTVLLLEVVAHTLKDHPQVNAWLLENGIYQCPQIDLGIAVDVGEGLMVPVIREADSLDRSGLAASLSDLADRARSKRLHAEDLAEATFSVTTLGSLGVRQFTPIISAPQCAILGIGAIEQNAVFGPAGIKPELQIHLSLSFDHAALDGVPAARFLQDVVTGIAALNAHISPTLESDNHDT